MVFFFKLYCLAYKIFFGWMALCVILSILGIISDVSRYGGTDWHKVTIDYIQMFLTWITVTAIWAILGGCLNYLYTKLTGKILPPGTIR
jgi:hypothetical protein